MHYIINPLVPNVPLLYPLKTSEVRKVFWYFQGVEKGCIGKDGLTQIFLRYYYSVHFYHFKNHVEEWNDTDTVNYVSKS